MTSSQKAFAQTYDRPSPGDGVPSKKAFAQTYEATKLSVGSPSKKAFAQVYTYQVPNTAPDKMMFYDTATGQYVAAPRYRWNGTAWVEIL